MSEIMEDAGGNKFLQSPGVLQKLLAALNECNEYIFNFLLFFPGIFNELIHFLLLFFKKDGVKSLFLMDW
mgnify:CR=1 FL=1